VHRNVPYRRSLQPAVRRGERASHERWDCPPALAIVRAAGDEHLVADVLRLQAWVLLRQGQPDAARPLLKEGLGLARRLGEPRLTAHLLRTRASAAEGEGTMRARPATRGRRCGCTARPVTGSRWGRRSATSAAASCRRAMLMISCPVSGRP